MSHETHLSAEKAQARENTRFPRPDADSRRANYVEAPSREGSQAAHGLMVRSAGARPRAGRGRLSRSADFDRVFRTGRSHAGPDLVLYVFPRGDEAPSRLGLSVSRRIGGAVERNRVKRLLREAFALESARLPTGTDGVVVARPGAGALAEREGLAGIRRALGELVGRVEGAAEPAPERSPDLQPAAERQSQEPDGESGMLGWRLLSRRLLSRGIGSRRNDGDTVGRDRSNPDLPASGRAGIRSALQVLPLLLRVRRAVARYIRHTPRAGPGRLAIAAMQSLEPRRV